MKLLIADDDRQIRNGLAEGIDWQSQGIDIVLTAADGLEALQLFDRENPEIVLTDIRMPGLDGIELSREIQQRSNTTSVIILSGYSDFEYARQAMRYGVQDYLLKPVEIEELLRVVQAAKDRISRISQLQDEQSLHTRAFRENFLNDVLSGKLVDNTRIAEQLAKHWQIGPGTQIRVVVLEIDQAWKIPALKDRQEFLAQVEPLLTTLTGETPLAICHRDERLIAILQVEPDRGRDFPADRSESQIRTLIAQLGLSMTITIALSRPGPPMSIRELYLQAETASRKKFYAGHAHVLIYDQDIPPSQPVTIDQSALRQLQQSIHDLDPQTASTQVHAIFAGLHAAHCVNRLGVDQFCTDLRNYLVENIKSQGFDFEGLFGQNLKLFERTDSLETLDEYRAWLNDFLVIVLSGLSEMKGARTNVAARKAAEYIQQNYFRDITLEEVAELVQKSPNYFSHIFKKVIGVSFSEYLNRIRITEAKKLLRTGNLMAYEIADKVGFQDYKYFNQVFRKLEGCSPSEYRKGFHHDDANAPA